jgi:hypothetical protein
MFLILRSTSLFSLSTSTSPLVCGPVTVVPPDPGDRAEPVVTPLPDDWAVPAVLVPGADGDARLTAFAWPLGSSPALFNPPGAAGPGGVPLTPCEPAPAAPALGDPAALPLLLPADPPADPPELCANEATGDITNIIAATAARNTGFILKSPFQEQRRPSYPCSSRNDWRTGSFLHIRSMPEETLCAN